MLAFVPSLFTLSFLMHLIRYSILHARRTEVCPPSRSPPSPCTCLGTRCRGLRLGSASVIASAIIMKTEEAPAFEENSMARIFITGSADGLGLMEARMLVAQGHEVVVHGRNRQRVNEALSKVPGALTAVVGDLASIAEMKSLADQVNELGLFDAVIHNAGIYHEPRLIRTIDGLPRIFAVNSLAPYVLTCLIRRPKRLVYTSSGLHRSGDATLNDLTWSSRPWSEWSAYADSKLHNVILAFAVARTWLDVLSNAMEPGWAATKMGGPGAPVSIEEGSRTQVWLAVSREKEALVSGKYFYHQQPRGFHPAAADPIVQERFLSECTRLSGIAFPV